jgi:hypothetical protein
LTTVPQTPASLPVLTSAGQLLSVKHCAESLRNKPVNNKMESKIFFMLFAFELEQEN